MNAVTTPKTFEQRMFESIRDKLPDMMTDDELRKLIDATMQKAFFEPRPNPNNGYGHPSTLPPLIVTMVEKHMASKVSELLTQWVAGRPEEVTRVLKETLEQGIFQMMLNHFSSRTSMPLQMLIDELRRKGVLG